MFVLTLSRAGKKCTSCGKTIGVTQSSVNNLGVVGAMSVGGTVFLISLFLPNISGILNFFLSLVIALLVTSLLGPKFFHLQVLAPGQVEQESVEVRKNAIVMLRWMLKMMIIIGIGALALWQVFSRLHLLDLE